MKLSLVEGKTAEEAGVSVIGTKPGGYVNHGTKVLKELLETWLGKGDTVIASVLYFDSVQSS